MPADYHDVLLGSAKILLGRPGRVACAQRSADLHLRGTCAHQPAEAAFGVAVALRGPWVGRRTGRHWPGIAVRDHRIGATARAAAARRTLTVLLHRPAPSERRRARRPHHSPPRTPAQST